MPTTTSAMMKNRFMLRVYGRSGFVGSEGPLDRERLLGRDHEALFLE